jgi:CheY-like chemotaxis protein
MPGGAVVGHSVLILDENTASRNFLANAFLEKQFKVTVAASGKEALIIAWRDLPDLILFDPVLSDIKVEEFIQKLRLDARTIQTPLIALSSDPSFARRETCLKAGVVEYLVKSAQAIPSLEETLTRLFGTEEPTQVVRKDKEKDGVLIVFLSAKGGTGTSSLCANLALNIKLAQPDASIVVADLVLPIGSIAHCRLEGGPNLATVAFLPDKQRGIFPREFAEPEHGISMLPGSPDPQHGNVLKGDRIGEIVATLRSAYDFIVLDIGRSLSRISLPLIQKANLITLIVSTDQSTIKLTKTFRLPDAGHR